MVGGRKVLLSIAVLSGGLGFDHVCGASRVNRRDGEVFQSLSSTPGGVESSTSSSAKVVSASSSVPIAPPPLGIVFVPYVPSSSASSSSTPSSSSSSSGSSSSGSSSSSTSSPAGVASSTPPSLPVIAPPPLGIVFVPGSSSSSTTRAPPPADTPASSDSQTLSLDPLRDTVSVNGGPTTSTGQEYVYPGAYGGGGALTTDTDAPSRTIKPTRSSIQPGGETNRGPPPADPGTTTPTQTQTTQVVVLGGGSEDSFTFAPVVAAPVTTSTQTTPADQATTPVVQAAPTPLRGGPPALGPPADLTSKTITKGTTVTMDLGISTITSSPTTFATSRLSGNQTFTYTPSVSVSYCQASDLTAATTTWSVVHTSTITWFGNPTDYTQPYPPVTTPETSSSCIVPIDPPRMTVSVCAATGTDSKYRTCDPSIVTMSFNFGIQTTSVPAIVFLTTDKNPAVVFTSIDTPDYGVSQAPKTRDNHASPTGAADDTMSTAVYNSDGPAQAVSDSAHSPTVTPVTVAVQPTGVVINGNTIRDNPSQPTQVVIVAGQTFTIDPTEVVGAGATIDRASATGGGIDLPTPTTTTLGGVSVVVSSSVAVIGGSSFTLGGTTPTTATVAGQTFTIGGSTIAAASQTVTLPTTPAPTEVVVAGGDLVTAIGSSVVVVHGTTLTYGTASSSSPDSNGNPVPVTTTTTIDGEVLTLGPGGVTLSNGDGGSTVIGGTHAAGASDTQYALVGGATLTKVGASVVVVQNRSYTLGTTAGTTGGTPVYTTVVLPGGETVTIAPTGVTVGTLTLRYPFGPTTVITPGAGASGGGATATSTGSAGGSGSGTGSGEEDAAGMVRPWVVGVVLGVGVAVGVGVMV